MVVREIPEGAVALDLKRHLSMLIVLKMLKKKALIGCMIHCTPVIWQFNVEERLEARDVETHTLPCGCRTEECDLVCALDISRRSAENLERKIGGC